jgi:predicted nucleic-acid-binding protein
MIAVDTNVLVRLLANDDPTQSPRAAQLFASEDVFIAKTVLLETEWVLRFSYGLPRAAISAAFQRLLAAPTVTVEDAPTIAAAVASHGIGMDFADGLHLASGQGVDTFATFDRKLAKQAGRAKVPRPVQLL